MKVPAQKVLDDYITTLRQTDKYTQAKNMFHVKERIEREIRRVYKATEFITREYFGPSPLARPDGERIFGHSGPTGPNKEYEYVVAGVIYSRPFQGFGVEHSIHPDGGGYLWLGECNNSAAYTPSDPSETWALWFARRAVPLDDSPYTGPTYIGGTSLV